MLTIRVLHPWRCKGEDAVSRLPALFVLAIIASFVINPNIASAHTNAAAGSTYTVQPGDTLSRIAAAYGLGSWEALYATNRDRISNPNVIGVGQVLIIPNGAGGTAPAPQPAPAGAGNITAIITAAAQRYGQSPAAMIAVAQCESSLNPNAYNGEYGASGLFQFLPSTWQTTPYASSNIFDPYASANAAGWMWSVGRRGEWVCQG
jgi:LysM repeat protein